MAPATSGNRYATDPKAVDLGRRLFADPALSKGGDVSCATCHVPSGGFASERVLLDPQRGWRNVPTLYGVAWQDFHFWDGRKDSLWSQAIAPLTNPLEHGLDEDSVGWHVRERYRGAYEAVFGALTEQEPKRVLANVGKALAAFEATVVPPRTAFDDFADGRGSKALADCAQEGARIFVGNGRCVSCHNGPLLTNGFFHNTGVPLRDARDNPAGFGVRFAEVASDPFKCKGAFADVGASNCRHVEHAPSTARLSGAMKTPTLRGVKDTAPYMHNGSLGTLRNVIDHYDAAPQGHMGDSEVFPLELGEADKTSLECFLRAL